MKFKKVIIDGREYYEKCEDAEEVKAAPEEDEEKNESADEGAKDSFLGEVGAFFEKFGAGAKDLGNKILTGTKDFGKKIREETERLWSKNKGISPDSKEGKLLKLLPYMSGEEAKLLCDLLLSDEKLLSKIDTADVIPYLPTEDAEKIFKRTVEMMEKSDLEAVIDYISPECLSDVVTCYVAGGYPNLDVDILYPYLKEGDIKRIFAYISSN